jgi:hypothetical protein
MGTIIDRSWSVVITGVSHLDNELLAILKVFRVAKPNITLKYANLS